MEILPKMSREGDNNLNTITSQLYFDLKGWSSIESVLALQQQGKGSLASCPF